MDKLYTGLLLSALILSCFIVETQTASCCVRYTRRRLHCENLRGFTIQTIHGYCDLDAVIFRTWNNKFICADPNKKQTQKMVRCLNYNVLLCAVLILSHWGYRVLCKSLSGKKCITIVSTPENINAVDRGGKNEPWFDLRS